MRVGNLTALLSVLFLAASCASLRTNDPVPPFYGMVYDMDNQPVQNAIVRVDGNDAAGTDVNGRFALALLPFGIYDVEFRKEGYEPLTVAVEYFSSTQVLYVKMISADQLLMEAEEAIVERRWEEAQSLVDRAELVRPDSPAGLYLKAVVAFRRGNAEAAKAILEGLLAREYNEPAIRLFLADILQYRLSDPAGAAEHLRAFLDLRYDPEAERRLSELEKAGE